MYTTTTTITTTATTTTTGSRSRTCELFSHREQCGGVLCSLHAVDVAVVVACVPLALLEELEAERFDDVFQFVHRELDRLVVTFVAGAVRPMVQKWTVVDLKRPRMERIHKEFQRSSVFVTECLGEGQLWFG